MDRRRLLRAGAAGLSGALLGGCFYALPERKLTTADFFQREEKVVRLRGKMRAKGVRYGAPVHLIAYKQEGVMEVWVEGANKRYKRFASYPICTFSGGVGPKLREGDSQTPEGFYEILPKMMNPWSSYHLGINLGFPNHYDRSYGRTGSLIAIHGGCASIGCFAMGNSAIEEIYLVVEQAFLQGAERATIASYPFRPTPAKLRAVRGHKWEGFWTNIFQSHSHFETLKRPPYYGVLAGTYLFTPYRQGTNTTRGYPRG